jgi:hypothetical protein
MNGPVLAWIVPVNQSGGSPPGIWGGPPNYIDIGGPAPQPPYPPLGFWGGRPPTYVDIGGPPQQGTGIWGGRPPNYVDIGGPGPQPPLGFWGGTPPPYVDIGLPPGGETGSVSQPIELPPDSVGGVEPGYWAQAFFPGLNQGRGGWVWVWVPVPTPKPGAPTPGPKK